MNLDAQSLLHLAPRVLELAEAAGREVLRIYRSDFTVEYKGDRSPLTAADLASQRLLAAGLAALAPAVPLLAEESAAADIAERRQWPTLWLVDPLDGTREFVKRNGQFTINIALVHLGAPLLGVLHAPALQQSFCGVVGAGAWSIAADGARIAMQVSQPAASPPRVLASASHRGRTLDRLLHLLGPHELVAAGSALKFAWLAMGRADFYPRLSPTSEWDTAAGQAIVEAAGGQVVGLDGQPLRYNGRDTLINPSFAAWGDANHDWLRLLHAASAAPANVHSASTA